MATNRYLKKLLPKLEIDPEVLRRVDTLPVDQLQSSFETIIMGLGVTYDEWVRGSAPPEEVEITLQALSALWNAMQKRAPK
jgi:hypothetical protein